MRSFLVLAVCISVVMCDLGLGARKQEEQGAPAPSGQHSRVFRAANPQYNNYGPGFGGPGYVPGGFAPGYNGGIIPGAQSGSQSSSQSSSSSNAGSGGFGYGG